jgi:ADP-ribosylglycohydrolase
VGDVITAADRILGCLQGVASGDAIGKQTETLTRDEVRRCYADGIRGFEGEPGTVIPRYAGNRKREWRVGETTDDTERTLAVARAIIRARGVAHTDIGREMLDCRKCIHPGLKSLWEFHQHNDPARVATAHDGCGAAIRVAPVGAVYPSQALDTLVTAAREASISTHGGSLAIAAAAATAAAVSAAIDGASPARILAQAEEAATEAERRWPGGASGAMARAIRAVHDDLAALPALEAGAAAASCFPDRPLAIVPLALALATLLPAAGDAILLAANIGGDSDSVASIAGGILGARAPDTVNKGWLDVVTHVNELDLAPVAAALASLRGTLG